MKTRTILMITAACGLLAAPDRTARAGQAASAPPSVSDETRARMAPEFSGDLNEVVKLKRSGVDESVILAFVQNSPVANRPGADEIIKLREAGISSPVIAAILQRGGELRSQQAARMQTASADAPQTPSAAYDTAPAYTAPASTVEYVNTYPAYPDYNYSYYYPGYYYSYYPYYYPFFPFFSSVFFRGGFHHEHFRAGVNVGGSLRATHFGGGSVSHFNSTSFSSGRAAGTQFRSGSIGVASSGGAHFSAPSGGGHFSGGMGHR